MERLRQHPIKQLSRLRNVATQIVTLPGVTLEDRCRDAGTVPGATGGLLWTPALNPGGSRRSGFALRTPVMYEDAQTRNVVANRIARVNRFRIGAALVPRYRCMRDRDASGAKVRIVLRNSISRNASWQHAVCSIPVGELTSPSGLTFAALSFFINRNMITGESQ